MHLSTDGPILWDEEGPKSVAKALQLKLIGHFGYMKCNPRTQMNRNGATTAIFKLWSIACDIGRKPPKNGQFSALRILRLFASRATE